MFLNNYDELYIIDVLNNYDELYIIDVQGRLQVGLWGLKTPLQIAKWHLLLSEHSELIFAKGRMLIHHLS